MKELKHQESKSRSIFEELEKMSIGDKLDKKEFILKHYPYCDYYNRRSFDVLYSNARKLMPDKKFHSRKMMIERIL